MEDQFSVVKFSEPLPERLGNSELQRGPNSLIGKHNELARICELEGGELLETMKDDYSAGTSNAEVDYWSYGTRYKIGEAEVTNHVEMRGNRETTIQYKEGHKPESLIKRMRELYKS